MEARHATKSRKNAGSSHATVERSVVLTGGWQTSKESAYVQAPAPATARTGFSPATNSTTKSKDPNRITRLADRMSDSRAHTPSIVHQEMYDPALGPNPRPATARTIVAAGLAR